MPRYEETTNEPVDIIDELVKEKFPQLSGARICPIFDTKKKTIEGRLCFARIQATNDILRYLSENEAVPEGYDYLIYLDKNVWEKLEQIDKRRLIFHELCHTDVNFDRKVPYKTRDHEILGFYDELDFNKDDPNWLTKLSVIGESVYSKEE